MDLTRDNATNVKRILEQLQEERWIDGPTAMVTIKLTLFNTNIGQYTGVR